MSALIYHKSTFCISYLKVVILLQDNLKIKLQRSILDFLYTFLFKSYTHKICTSRLPILGSRIYYQTKPDIENLRSSLVVTNVRRNQANWHTDKGAESFEIMPPSVELSILT